MKSIIAIFLLFLINSSVYTQDTLKSAALKESWIIQCRIKQKGTFVLTQVHNKKADLAKKQQKLADLEEDLKEFVVKEGDEYTAAEAAVEAQKTKISEYEEEAKEKQEELQKAQEEAKENLDAEVKLLGTDQATAETPQKISDLKKKLAAANHEFDVWNNGRDDNIDLHLDDSDNSVEIPSYCQQRLTPIQLATLGTTATDLRDKWIKVLTPDARKKLKNKHHMRFTNDRSDFVFSTEEGEETNVVPSFKNMPPLNRAQFAQFYQQYSASATSRQDQAIYLTTAEDGSIDEAASADQVLEVFQTVLFNQHRSFVTWLEFWVYQCSGGIKPDDDAYMVPEDDVSEESIELMKEDKPMWTDTPELDEAIDMTPPGRRMNQKKKVSKNHRFQKLIHHKRRH